MHASNENDSKVGEIIFIGKLLSGCSFLYKILSDFVAPSLQLRLLRVFKLAQTWSTMRVLLAIVIKTLGAMGNLTFILVIVMYIFAVIGMQLFSTTYTEDKFAPDEKPRYERITHSI